MTGEGGVMKVLRSTAGWFLMGLAALVLCVWAVAHFVTGKVESGRIASPIIDAVLHQENVQETIAEQAQTMFAASLEGGGIVLSVQQTEELNDAIASAVASEEFIDDVVEIAQEAEADVIAQLTDDSLPLAPLSIRIDITDPLYTIIGAIPGLEALVPSTRLDPIEIGQTTVDGQGDGIEDGKEPLVDVDTVERIRNGYGVIETVSMWTLWLGLGLIALAVLVIPRRRWIIPKVLLGLGLSTLFVWLIASRINVDSLLDVFFDKDETEVRDLAADVLPQSKVDGVQSTLWRTSVILLLLAVAGYVVVWYVFRKRAAAKRGGIAEGETAASAPHGVLALVSKRWTLPKNLFKLGLTGLVLWFLASRVNVEGMFTDPDQSRAHDFINDFLPQSRVDGFQFLMLIVWIVFFALTVAGFVLVWLLSRAAKAGQPGGLPEEGSEGMDEAVSIGDSEKEDAADVANEVDSADFADADESAPAADKAGTGEGRGPRPKGGDAKGAQTKGAQTKGPQTKGPQEK
jgi:flagellar basal body-associated protein FliL